MSDYGTLHVYPQHSWHSSAEVVGCPLGLTALRDAITDAIETGNGESIVVASDGEGYTIYVRKMPSWPGDNYGKDWENDKPWYEMVERWPLEGERDQWKERTEKAEAELAKLRVVVEVVKAFRPGPKVGTSDEIRAKAYDAGLAIDAAMDSWDPSWRVGINGHPVTFKVEMPEKDE